MSKLSELVLYIANKSQDDLNFGVTKLNKILFFADFYFYGLTGKSISECTYHHIQRGPAPTAMKPVLDELENTGRAKIEKKNFYGYHQDRVKSLDSADISLFEDEELLFVDSWIEYFRPYNGTDLSDLTHTLNPWLLTKFKEEIPYHTVFMMKDRPVEIDGHIWAKQELQRLRKIGYQH